MAVDKTHHQSMHSLCSRLITLASPPWSQRAEPLPAPHPLATAALTAAGPAAHAAAGRVSAPRKLLQVSTNLGTPEWRAAQQQVLAAGPARRLPPPVAAESGLRHGTRDIGWLQLQQWASNRLPHWMIFSEMGDGDGTGDVYFNVASQPRDYLKDGLPWAQWWRQHNTARRM